MASPTHRTSEPGQDARRPYAPPKVAFTQLRTEEQLLRCSKTEWRCSELPGGYGQNKS